MKYPLTFLAYLILPAASACGGTETSDVTHTVRDSAGIQIVENISPTWTDGEVWHVDTVPAFDLSGAEDDELYRPGSPRLLDDGRLVLFNDGTCEVRFYDQNEGLLSSFGRCGKGPGEFEWPARVRPWRGDSLLVVDQWPQRASVLDDNGTLSRTAPLPASSDLPLPLFQGVMEDSALVLAGPQDPGLRDSPGTETSQTRLGLSQDLHGAPALVGTYPGPVWEYTEYQGRIGRGVLAFSSSTAFAVGDAHLFVGFPDRYEIQVLTPDGAVRRIIRRAFQPVRVTQADIDWLMERRLSQVEGADNQRAVRRAFRELQHADVMPAFGTPVWPGGAEGGPDMLADAAGNLWVFEHYRPGEYRNEWSVFSPEGVWLGTAALPEHFTPAQIGEDFVLGRRTDDTGFVHIRRHRLIKP
jgi:hypothetical protein